MGGGGTTIQAPPAPNYGESMREVLQSQVEMAPQVYASEAQYQPLYNVLQANQQAFQAQQALNIARQAFPQVADIEAAYSAANRSAELGQIQEALPAYQQAFNALTPGYQQAVSGAGLLAQQAMQQALTRPQFTAFESGVVDPYGMPVASQAPQVVAPPLTLAQPVSRPTAIARPTAPASEIRADDALSNKFLEVSKSQAPKFLPPPVDPGPPIQPIRGRGTFVSNQAEIDAQNAKIEKYKADIAAYQAQQPSRTAYFKDALKNYNPAATFAPQQTQAASTQAVAQQPILQAYTQAPAGSAAPPPAAQVGQQIQPTGLQATPAGKYLEAVTSFTPTNVATAAGTPKEAGFFKSAQTVADAIKDVGSVPGETQMARAQSAIDAAKSAGVVPSATNTFGAPSTSTISKAAGNVPEAQKMASAQTAQQALQNAGAVPSATYALGAQTAQQALQLAGSVPEAQRMAAAQSAQQALQEAGAVPTPQNIFAVQSAESAAGLAGGVPSAENLSRIYGPRLASNIQNIDQESVQNYIGAMPGMGDYANLLAQRSRAELEAGKSLTAEEQRMADQAARAAYASRGTALGNQAVAAEVLNRADVANQRYQQRLQNAAQAAGTIQAIYQPALQQSLQRQQLGIEYGLGSQQQAFAQAQARDVLSQQLQAQRYLQSMGTQAASFEQAATRDQMLAQLQAQKFGQLSSAQQAGFQQASAQDAMAAQLQAQRFGQLSQTQQAGFEQAAAKDSMLAQLQAQRYGQLSDAQKAGFGQAQAQDAAAQSLQAQRYAQAMGIQTTAFEQAQAKDAIDAQLQAQRYAQAMGAQSAGFQQAQARDVFGQATQAQRYEQAIGAQGTAFQQAASREALAQQIQQQRYSQLMGQQQLLQGAQAQRFEQAMGREQLRAGTQQAAFQQALARNQAQQQAYMSGAQAQTSMAQLGAGAMGQLQSAQAPILQAFYKQPILQNQANQAQSMGLAMQQQAGPQYFNPESQTGMGSIYGAYNSQMNLAAAQAQANAGKKAGMMGMLGNLGGSAIGAAGLLAFCWVAREVYGAENPKWLQFREWMLAEADDNLLDAYITHGPKIAEFISDKPDLKQMIKTWMDSKIS